MAKCPKCGSTQVSYKREEQGTNSHSHYYRVHKGTSLLAPVGTKKYRSVKRYATVGLCKNCGHCWKKKTFSDKLWGFLGLLLIISVIVAAITSENEKKVTMPDNMTTSTGKAATSVWAEEITPLSDFKYYVNQNQIVLKKYHGDAKKVNIGANYDVDGQNMDVVALEGTFIAKKVTSVIVPEGVKKIQANTFNSSGIDYLFLPSTLEDFMGWSYFHDVEKLYFGGNEEQWQNIAPGERNAIDVVRIILEAKVENLLDLTEE